MADHHKYLTAAETIALLECSRATLRRLIDRGLLIERTEIASHRRYLRESVNALVARWNPTIQIPKPSKPKGIRA
jgi:hypothetical protein